MQALPIARRVQPPPIGLIIRACSCIAHALFHAFTRPVRALPPASLQYIQDGFTGLNGEGAHHLASKIFEAGMSAPDSRAILMTVSATR